MPFFKKWKNNSKHQKLQSEKAALGKTKEVAEEEILETPENSIEVFKIKYLGSTVVEKNSLDNVSTESVKNVTKVAKASKKKVQRVNMTVSSKGISVDDVQGSPVLDISIYRISNCATDPKYKQVFSFISTDEMETMECHVFWCSKRKTAESVALSVARAFSSAYENWRMSPLSQQFEKSVIESIKNKANGIKIEDIKEPSEDGSCKNESTSSAEEKLIDFDDEDDDDEFNVVFPPCRFIGDESNKKSSANDLFGLEKDLFIPVNTNVVDTNTKNDWVCFDDDFEPKPTQCSNQYWKSNTNKIDLVFA